MKQNVFFESGFADEDATVLALETDAAIEIARFIRRRFTGSQTAAARHLKIGQNEVSAILSGNIARFSLARLIKIARRAGLRLYFDMGDNAHGANVSTLIPTFAAPVIEGEFSLNGPFLDVDTVVAARVDRKSRAGNQEAKVLESLN